MRPEHFDFVAEEPSMEVFLRGMLPRLLGGVSFDVHPSQCKEELLAQLPGRLRGYAAWLPRGYQVVVVVDRDDDDCQELKRRLEQMTEDAGLSTSSHPMQGRFAVICRIAVEELEAWYFGDWEAVRAAYPSVSPTVPKKAQYRDPDRIAGGTKEAFERLLQRAGHFRGGLRELEAARSIAAHMDPARNTSHSFQVLCRTLQGLAGSS